MTHPDAIPEFVIDRFAMVKEAVRRGRVALMSCRSSATDEKVYIVCAVNHNADKSIDFVPLASICTADNPYEAFRSPMQIDKAREAGQT